MNHNNIVLGVILIIFLTVFPCFVSTFAQSKTAETADGDNLTTDRPFYISSSGEYGPFFLFLWYGFPDGHYIRFSYCLLVGNTTIENIKTGELQEVTGKHLIVFNKFFGQNFSKDNGFLIMEGYANFASIVWGDNNE